MKTSMLRSITKSVLPLVAAALVACAGPPAEVAETPGSDPPAPADMSPPTTKDAKPPEVMQPSPAMLVDIRIDPAFVSIPVGIKQQLHAFGQYSDGTTRDVTKDVEWSSADQNVVAISNEAGSKGLAEGLALGEAFIDARKGAIFSKSQLYITALSLVSLKVSPDGVLIPKGLKQQFTAEGTFDDGSVKDITASVLWASSDESVQVSNEPGESGLAYASGQGAAVISAQLLGFDHGVQMMVDAAELVSIAVSPDADHVAKGLAKQFRAEGTYTDGSTQDLTLQVIWSTSDESALSISNEETTQGLAQGLSEGEAIVTATYQHLNASAAMVVSPHELASLAICPEEQYVEVGGSVQFSATGIYSDGETEDMTAAVVWSSADENVATVGNERDGGEAGKAQAAAPGDIDIVATMGDLSAKVSLHVAVPELVDITVLPGNASIQMNHDEQFQAVGTYSDGSTLDLSAFVTWSSSNESVCLISSNEGSMGLLSGLSHGECIITATLSGVIGTTKLAVIDPEHEEDPAP
ncbi:MAG: hypothetical protein EXR72_01220 [Myxococcales bacterium]|nr:hypothetical protein [Myxococcales bacterium]